MHTYRTHQDAPGRTRTHQEAARSAAGHKSHFLHFLQFPGKSGSPGRGQVQLRWGIYFCCKQLAL